MTDSTPRIAPLSPEDCDDDTRATLAAIPLEKDGDPLSLFRTWAHHPQLLRRYLPFGHQLLFGGVLPPRDREFAVLRTAWITGADFEWGHHVQLAVEVGLTDEEIRSAASTEEFEFPAAHALLVRAVDELCHGWTIQPTTWHQLQTRYDERELIELVILVGHYVMLAGFINSVDIRNDTGATMPRPQAD